IGNGNRPLGRAHFAVRHPQPFKGLRRGHFVNEVTVDIKQAGAVCVLLDDMGIPNLVVECLAGHDIPPGLAMSWFLGCGKYAPRQVKRPMCATHMASVKVGRESPARLRRTSTASEYDRQC